MVFRSSRDRAGACTDHACFPDWDVVGPDRAAEAVRVCWVFGAAAEPEPESGFTAIEWGRWTG